MSLPQFAGGIRHIVLHSRLSQIGLIAGFWLLGEGIVSLTGLPVPGSVVGLFIMLALLMSGILKLSSVRRGSQWYMAEMLLFFIPAVLAVLDHREFFGLLGLKILAVIIVGTMMVMCATALAVEFGLRLSQMLSRASKQQQL